MSEATIRDTFTDFSARARRISPGAAGVNGSAGSEGIVTPQIASVESVISLPLMSLKLMNILFSILAAQRRGIVGY